MDWKTWARCLPLLRALGIDTDDLSLDRLFEPVNLQHTTPIYSPALPRWAQRSTSESPPFQWTPSN